MYRDVYYNSRKRCVHLWTWDEQGNRIEVRESFKPYFYIESDVHKDATSIFNSPLRKIEFETNFDREKYLKDTGLKRVFHKFRPDQQFLIDKYNGLNETPDFSKFPLKVLFLDIETDTYIHGNDKKVKIRKKLDIEV